MTPLLLLSAASWAAGLSALPPDFNVEAAGKIWTVTEAAEAFEPYLAPGEFSDRTICYFRALLPRGDVLPIVYYFSWSDERNPSALLHFPYRLWRRLFFGSVEDIEYVYVEANLGKRRPQRIAFESPKGYYVVRHELNVLDKAFPISGTHPVLRPASWNHIFELAAGPEPSAATPLRFMDDALYARLRMARRSSPPPELTAGP